MKLHKRGNLLPSWCVQRDPLSSHTILLDAPDVRLMRMSTDQVWGHCRGACVFGEGGGCKIMNSYSGIYASRKHLHLRQSIQQHEQNSFRHCRVSMHDLTCKGIRIQGSTLGLNAIIVHILHICTLAVPLIVFTLITLAINTFAYSQNLNCNTCYISIFSGTHYSPEPAAGGCCVSLLRLEHLFHMFPQTSNKLRSNAPPQQSPSLTSPLPCNNSNRSGYSVTTISTVTT